MNAKRKPRNTSDDLAVVAEEAMQITAQMVEERLGRPYYVCAIVFPAEAHERVCWSANSHPSERPKLAAALAELLIKWGFIKS